MSAQSSHNEPTQNALTPPRETWYETIPFSDEAFPIRVLFDMESRFPTEQDATISENHSITWHEQLEILYILEGNLICECDFRHYVCGEGDIVIINTCEAHAFGYFEKPARYHCIMIDPRLCGGRDDISVQKYLEPITNRRLRFNNVISGNEKARAIIEEMIEEIRAAAPGYELSVKGNLLRLLSLLFRSEIAAEEEQKKNGDLNAIAPALRYIADHFVQDISLAELASVCCMNRSYFCRQFHEITGRTAIAYVNEYRLAKAKALLLTTSRCISEIAAATGFADSSYFTRKFKELYGSSPSAMRKQI